MVVQVVLPREIAGSGEVGRVAGQWMSSTACMKGLTMHLARVKLSLGQPHRTLVVPEHFLQEVSWER